MGFPERRWCRRANGDPNVPAKRFMTTVALLCAGTAACTGYEPRATPPGISSLQDQRRATIDRLRAETLRPLTRWQQETPPSCNSPSLAKASASARMTAGMLSPERHGIDTAIEGGS